MKLAKSPVYEDQWLSLLHNLVSPEGVYDYISPDKARSGVGYRLASPIIGAIESEYFPFITSVPTPPRLAFEELWWMLRGGENSKELEEKGVNFWKANTSREFLDSRELFHLEEGSMGTSYGYQWRKSGGGYDQLLMLFKGLWEDTYSRRHIVSLWSPYELYEMPLTPCWYSSQWWITGEGEKALLHLHLNNRSLDVLFGMNYAIMQYRMLQASIASLLGVGIGRMTFISTMPHIYDNQIVYARELLGRDLVVSSLHSPHLEINLGKEENYRKAIIKLLSMEWGKDILANNYFPNKSKFRNQRPPMVA